MAHVSNQGGRWWERAWGAAVVGGVLLLLVGGIFWMLLGVPEGGLERFALIGDSFGGLTSLFAALAFGFSILTNMSQTKELSEQRELNRQSLQVLKESAYAQRIQSLQTESEMYRAFVVDVLRGLENLQKANSHLGHKVNRDDYSSRIHESATLEERIRSINQLVPMPFEDLEVDDTARMLMQLLRTSRDSLHFVQERFRSEDRVAHVTTIKNSLDSSQGALSQIPPLLDELTDKFHEWYGGEIYRLRSHPWPPLISEQQSPEERTPQGS